MHPGCEGVEVGVGQVERTRERSHCGDGILEKMAQKSSLRSITWVNVGTWR